MTKASSYTDFKNGVVIRGLPLQMTNPGKVFWVNGSTVLAEGGIKGADGSGKGTYHQPFATIDYAIGRCTASRGDIIMVMPGHTEAVTTDGGIALDVAGITVIGLGQGALRPTITMSTLAAATVTITAANVTLKNLVFLGNKNDLTSLLEIAGDSADIDSCEFRESTAGMLNAVVVGVADADADYTHIHNCKFYMDEPGVTNVGDAAITINKDVDHVTIENNFIYGDFDLAGIDVPAGGNASDQLVISNNYVENTATGQHAIQVNTAGTMLGGAILDNRLVGDTSAALLEPHTLQTLGNLGNTGVGGDFPVPGYLVGTRATRLAVNTVADMSSGHGTADDPALFTVTGDVAVRVWGVVKTTVASTSDTGTLSVGVADLATALIPLTAADTTSLVQHDVIGNNATTLNGQVLETGGQYLYISNGVDITEYVATNNMTAGAITWYCEWFPVSADGDVKSA